MLDAINPNQSSKYDDQPKPPSAESKEPQDAAAQQFVVLPHHPLYGCLVTILKRRVGGHADCCGKIKVENLNNKCPGSGKEKARSEERKCIFQRIRRKGSRKTQQISLKQPGSASCLFLHLSLVLSYYETGMRGK